MTTPFFETFTKELVPLRYGLPLWIPESHDNREVNLGDIGWLSDGGFNVLFNCTKSAEHPLNKRFQVPPNFKELDINDTHISSTIRFITDPIVCSRSMRKIKVASEVAAAM